MDTASSPVSRSPVLPTLLMGAAALALGILASLVSPARADAHAFRRPQPRRAAIVCHARPQPRPFFFARRHYHRGHVSRHIGPRGWHRGHRGYWRGATFIRLR